ncbi:MAG: hypothetical protein KatS3mg108_3003 [Isosphaeraceae bacterium]|jgi:hypothetical protein|nr:MAG: hypothetical protein KatS3mg108_3003 [Isosphaeraceae bacterium]
MSQTHNEPVPQVACRHLRHKGMYVYTDGLGSETHEGYDNTIFWCLKTMKSFGPDDDLVDRDGCCNRERSCYEPT